MLSKEKKKLTIEEWLKVYNDLKNNTSLVESISTEPFIEFVDLLLSKIQQLETREQKLIDKLEEDIENSTKGLDTNILLIKEYYKNKIEYAQEILSIVKDNKKTTFPKK